MFGSIDKSKGYLFSTYDLQQSLQNAASKLREDVGRVQENQLLNSAPTELAKHLADQYKVNALSLSRDDWYADTHEVKVDVRYDSSRYIRDTSRPALVAGERVEVRVPFEGDADLFYSQANIMSSNPPRAVIERGELVLSYESPFDAPRDVRPMVDRALADIQQMIDSQQSMIAAHNASIAGIAETAILERRARLLAQSQRAAALGIPVRRKQDAPKTYAVPVARRTAVPSMPPASSAPYQPEPTWAMDQYEHALKIMQDMAMVMERSPDAFRAMDEEALRQHFLVQLNGQFEGKATAETFNMAGKTDILLREGERNVFIAECKFWKGPKGFGEAIDQLLSYTTWRDSKSAILIFNRGTGTSTVLSGADTVARAHANFKRNVIWPHESGFRYIFHVNGDPHREIILTVLVFNVPA